MDADRRTYRPLAAFLLAFPAATAMAQAPPVAVDEVRIEPIVRVIRVSGTVTSPRASVLSPAVAGLIDGFDVDAGDRVREGDRLVVLDAELERLSLARNRAALAEAQAALGDARRRLEEAERLVSDRSISESEVKSRRAEVEIREAALAAVDAELGYQQGIVRRHEVLAPFDGVVSRRDAEVGEWVGPGDALLELVATEDLRFDFRVPQEFWSSIDVGTRVTVRLDAMPGSELEGDIRAIVPVKDPGGRTFLMRVLASGDDGARATPGMSARGDVFVDTGRRGIVVPRDALLRYPDGRTTVWVVDRRRESPAVSERQVVTGLEFDGVVEVASGLEDGDVVVTRGNEALQEGQAVSIVAAGGR